jgi:hypothetical protein
MSDEWNYLDLGFYLATDTAWQQLEASLPAEGADCPPTLDLLDSNLRRPIEPARLAALEIHLQGCDYCRRRAQSQQRALERLARTKAG